MVEYVYDNPTSDPKESSHWLGLEHKIGDRVIENPDMLHELFLSDFVSDTKTQGSKHHDPRHDHVLAFWSCLLGYCEALCTCKDEKRRWSLFPIPIDALHRLVITEFALPETAPPLNSASHRPAAQIISNWIWSKVVSKSNVKDEKHANSLYTVLRGRIDGKSVDCFGAALTTVIGLRQQGYSSSTLTLSEDHAYESHYVEGKVDRDADSANSSTTTSQSYFTCEVAIPGNTKAQKARRGQEIAKTFQKNASAKSRLTPETSWLYMGTSAVYCQSTLMIVAAALANLNCLIELTSQAGGKSREVNSEPLLVMKRNFLWALKDAGHLKKFPFALCELGWSEEHCTSPRGEARISIPKLDTNVPVCMIEACYHEAIICCQTHYQDKQVYPYCYMGFYHKDGGQDEEYRLGVALQYFSEAARVSSGYVYEWGDTLQLTKVMTKLSEFIVYEILSVDGAARRWQKDGNAIECAQWLIIFYDHLLMWEEISGEQSFLQICTPKHKTGIAKAFSLLSRKIRAKAFDSIGLTNLRSKRLRRPGSLVASLQLEKVSIPDANLTILTESKRDRKRKAR